MVKDNQYEKVRDFLRLAHSKFNRVRALVDSMTNIGLEKLGINCDPAKYLNIQSDIVYDKFLVYQFDNVGFTPLHWAVKKDLFEMSELLIEFYSRINVRDFFNRTPIQIAVRRGHLRIVKLLLANKAI